MTTKNDLIHESEIEVEILNNKHNLDSECWCCKKGQTEPIDIHTSEHDGSCEICGGTGFVPTELGDAIIKFIKRHGDKIG